MIRRFPNPIHAAGTLALWVAAVWTLSAAENPVHAAPADADCEATFTPSVIEAGTVHEEVEVSMTEDIRDIDEVLTPDESGLTILWIHSDDEEAESARVRVSALGAEVGVWDVVLRNERGETCHGQLTVLDAD